jgi:type II secretory pathway pseudopilin PulG
MSPGHIAIASATRKRAGVVLLALLIAMMLGAIGALAAVEAWMSTRQHEKEVQLLYVGDQYRQAIRRYYYSAPRGQARVLPARLEDLLDDDRSPVTQHHLRRLFPDPVTASSEWGLLMQGDRITGVYSLSEAAPMKHTGFDPADASFEDKKTYREWVFAFSPGRSGRR